MAKNGFLRVLASGKLPLLLLLVLATTTPTSNASTTTVAAMSEQAASTSLSPADDDDTTTATACLTEATACEDDATCLSCHTEISTSSTDFRECGEAIGLDDVESSTATCSDYIASMCCVEEASELECLENDAFAAFWACSLESVGCGEEIVACDGVGGVETEESASNGAPAATTTATASTGHASTAFVLSSVSGMFLGLLLL